MLHNTPHIELLGREQRAAFFAYLSASLADNGRGDTPIFQPMSRTVLHLPDEKIAAFNGAFDIDIGQAGWRRCLVALNGDGAIVGHIDLRARPENDCTHRLLLGMGVRGDHRRRGLGQRLMEAVLAWARSRTNAEWIDLEVMSLNEPARRLYDRCGFVRTGEIRDMYRIDGVALAETYMSLKLSEPATFVQAG